MGNSVAKLSPCCGGYAGAPRRSRRHVSVAVTSEPFDDGIGHSFRYVRPDAPDVAAAGSKIGNLEQRHHLSEEATTTFCSISGAALSANTATPLSTSSLLLLSSISDPSATAAAFESSNSFTSGPLQFVPRYPSGPASAPLDCGGFSSGPLEGGFQSGPLEKGFFSGPLRRSLSHGGRSDPLRLPRPRRILRTISKAVSRTLYIRKPDLVDADRSSPDKCDDPNRLDSMRNSNLQWAQGKAGEDRVHVVVSEDRGWLFVGIYDGFNGPDATDYLLSNLYSAVQLELKGLLWDDSYEAIKPGDDPLEPNSPIRDFNHTGLNQSLNRGKRNVGRRGGPARRWEENQRRWKYEWSRERLELEQKLKEYSGRSSSAPAVNHQAVLKALSQALRKTEEAYLDVADKMLSENPELALMGSCVLAMLMKGEDVYLMSVGDSRALLAMKAEPDVWGFMGRQRSDLERIKEETLHDLEARDQSDGLTKLAAVQLTLDHSTCVQEEVRRIRKEHPDDDSAIVNDRVKGSLKVTRAFGAGFLKQPKWNDVLLEMFRIDYVGTSPYINCNPFLYHHKLRPKDRFLILSSDGLYQYFTNEQAVAEVELFIEFVPEGDPAQHLVEEVLFRAAEKAGMDLHQLLEIPQGDRRRYHDDVSVIVISLEGRIWKSCV